MKARFSGSLLIGAVIAAALVIYEDKYRHAELAASAALNHQTVAFTLFWGFVGTALISAAVVFVLAAVFAARTRRRQAAAASRAWQGAPQPRRRGRAGAWR